MKKLLSLLCAITLSVSSNAQGLGDYMEIDGVHGCVFYLDESGEHGLIISSPGLDQKMLKKSSKQLSKLSGKMGISIEEQEASQKQLSESKMIIPVPSKEVSSKEMKKIYKELVSLLCDDGEQNAIIIADYCKDKGLSMQDYFPCQYWASQLGDGWFIPGDKELTLFADFFAGGLGKENSFHYNAFINRPKELSNNPLCQSIIGQCSRGFYSSTIKHADCGYRALMYESHGLSKNWFNIFDTWEKGNPNHCAVHKF